jgi:DNA-binding transcriptional LysR family regulator
MELSQIRYFLAAAEALNFTHAAETCAVSQPALSKSIRKLEDTLGAELFDRNSQNVRLTEFGRTMRVHLERIDDSRRKARDAAKIAANTDIERLDVGVMCTIGPLRFSRFLEAFRARHPHIEVTLHDVVASTIPQLLLSGGLNCVLCARGAHLDRRFQAVELFTENLAVAFAEGHRFAGFEEVPLDEIAKEPYLDRLHCEFRDDFLERTKASGLTLNVVLRSEREDWIVELVQNGLGVSVMPASSVDTDRLMYRPVGELADARMLELVLTNNAETAPAVSAFRNAALEFDWT